MSISLIIGFATALIIQLSFGIDTLSNTKELYHNGNQINEMISFILLDVMLLVTMLDLGTVLLSYINKETTVFGSGY